MEKGSPEELVRATVSRAEPIEVREVLKQVALEPAATRTAVQQLIDSGDLLSLDGAATSDASLLFTTPSFRALTGRLREPWPPTEQSPLRRGMPPQELRNRLGLSSRAFEGALGLWTESGTQSISPAPSPCRTTRQPPTQRRQPARRRSSPPPRPTLRAGPETPIDDDLLAYLEDRGPHSPLRRRRRLLGGGLRRDDGSHRHPPPRAQDDHPRPGPRHVRHQPQIRPGSP